MDRLPLEIRLDVSHHCIETELKRQYNRSLSDFFRLKGKNDEVEKTITLLQHALEHFDFQTLRSRYPELSGQATAAVFLTMDKQNTIALTLDKKVIYP